MPYSYPAFIGPISTSDKLIKFYDTKGVLIRSLDPFKVVTLLASNNLVIIKLKSSQFSLDFTTSNEAKQALSLLQSTIDNLTTSTSPLFVERTISNYITTIGTTGTQGNTGPQGTGTSEVVNSTPGATATNVVYDFTIGAIWYHATASTNYSANFTNIPTTNNRAITATIIISQGATGYSPTSVRIDGVTQSIKWSSGTYSVSTNKVDIVGFTFLRSDNSWSQVFGQISSFS